MAEPRIQGGAWNAHIIALGVAFAVTIIFIGKSFISFGSGFFLLFAPPLFAAFVGVYLVAFAIHAVVTTIAVTVLRRPAAAVYAIHLVVAGAVIATFAVRAQMRRSAAARLATEPMVRAEQDPCLRIESWSIEDGDEGNLRIDGVLARDASVSLDYVRISDSNVYERSFDPRVSTKAANAGQHVGWQVSLGRPIIAERLPAEVRFTCNGSSVLVAGEAENGQLGITHVYPKGQPTPLLRVAPPNLREVTTLEGRAKLLRCFSPTTWSYQARGRAVHSFELVGEVEVGARVQMERVALSRDGVTVGATLSLDNERAQSQSNDGGTRRWSIPLERIPLADGTERPTVNVWIRCEAGRVFFDNHLSPTKLDPHIL